MDSCPNFSGGHLYTIKAQIQLKQDYLEMVKEFKKSLVNSKLYTAKEKKELELQEMAK